MSWKKLKCKIRMLCCCKIECKKENNISVNYNGESTSNYKSAFKTKKEEEKIAK